MIQERFWVLVAKKMANEANEQELVELNRHLQDHPEWQFAIQNLENIWQIPAPHKSNEAEDAFMLHLNRCADYQSFDLTEADAMVSGTKPFIPKWVFYAAASFIFLIGLTYFITQKTVSKTLVKVQPESNEISTRLGSKSQVKLPDGSIVWLNSGSKLIYPKEFGKSVREVTLTGEGYFDVVKNKDVPFIINTNSIRIKVLGTVFNVKAYPEDKQTETSLIQGRIEVTIKNRPEDKIILSPNEKLIVENALVESSKKQKMIDLLPAISINKLKFITPDSTVAENQWVENKLVFRDETFEEIALMMERWYNVKLDIQTEKLKSTRMNGNFEKETVDQAIEALKLIIPFKTIQKGNTIIIYQ
ncbi:FecR family protein [Sediminibacterium salmoneum]|uniref:FecR family protein n=1 Tax=Sediminibacterium salmoneum TaxID=426421 RepID=UPI00047962FF|nr:FecR family protein [Sediminibacterium salmoneum]